MAAIVERSVRSAVRMRRAVSLGVAMLLTGLVLVGPAPAGATSDTLKTGFMDDAVLNLGDGERAAWLGRATGVGASVMRVNLHWDEVARNAPTSDATDPLASGYAFAAVDGKIRAAQAAGMTVLLNVSRSPTWAQGPGRPKSFVSYGAVWKPDPGAFGQFMTAVARRYSGTTPDPANPGQTLPKVDAFQIWNEPNLNLDLGPQYENGKPFAPIRFRELLNAGYAAVKAVQPTATVVAAGMAPFGDPVSKDARRTRPIAFLRSLFCLDERLKKVCSDTVRTDVVSLHPYAVDRPSRKARDRDDATVPDLARVTTVVRAARRARTVGPKLPETWVTEFSYDSSPPDPKGVPVATRARWISESFWRLWEAGASTIVWYLARDAAPTPSYAATYQSGIFLRDGRRKADARAFRFPLLVTGRNRKNLTVWFRTPSAGTTTLQVRRKGRWSSVRKIRRLRRDEVRIAKVPRAGVTAVRGVAGRATSYAWTLR